MNVLAGFREYQEFRTPKAVSTPTSSADLAVVADELSPSEAVGRLVQSADAALAVDLLTGSSPSPQPSSNGSPCACSGRWAMADGRAFSSTPDEAATLAWTASFVKTPSA